jgi:hypothetical protein
MIKSPFRRNIIMPEIIISKVIEDEKNLPEIQAKTKFEINQDNSKCDVCVLI